MKRCACQAARFAALSLYKEEWTWDQSQGETYPVSPSRGTLSRAGMTGTQGRFSGETVPTRGARFRESRGCTWPCFPAWGVCCTKEGDNFSRFTCRSFPQRVSRRRLLPAPGQHDLGLAFHSLEDIGSHIKSFALPKMLSPKIPLSSCLTTGQ